jgi:hypothetical protein
MKITSNLDLVLKSIEEKKLEVERKLKAMTVGFAQLAVESAIKNTKLGDPARNPSLYEWRQKAYGLQPVKGFARGSWRYSESTGNFIQTNYGDESGAVAASQFRKDAIGQYQLGDTFYISNTGYYIEKIQYRQNPLGVIAPTLQEMLSLQRTVLKEQYDRG